MELITFQKTKQGWRKCTTNPIEKTKKYSLIYSTRKQARKSK